MARRAGGLVAGMEMEGMTEGMTEGVEVWPDMQRNDVCRVAWDGEWNAWILVIGEMIRMRARRQGRRCFVVIDLELV